MKFKVDENLPVELTGELRGAGHEAATVAEQHLVGSDDIDLSETCRPEDRVLVTLDLDFADIRTYPPQDYPGMIVLLLSRQEKPYVLDVFRKLLTVIGQEPLEGRLWIAEENRIRIR
jgi:predicted nuclease of predicted toxin-antitoxin system